MAPAASVAISLSIRFLPPRLYRGRVSVPRPIRSSSGTNGVASGERKVWTLERKVGDLRALVASVPPAVASVRAPLCLVFLSIWIVGLVNARCSEATRLLLVLALIVQEFRKWVDGEQCGDCAGSMNLLGFV